jgi:hypothetical protein
MEFTAWWEKVIGRLRSGGFEELPEVKPVDHEAFQAGMESDEWAWAYYTADIDVDSPAFNGEQHLN